jgi:hypothetical protein
MTVEYLPQQQRRQHSQAWTWGTLVAKAARPSRPIAIVLIFMGMTVL